MWELDWIDIISVYDSHVAAFHPCLALLGTSSTLIPHFNKRVNGSQDLTSPPHLLPPSSFSFHLSSPFFSSDGLSPLTLRITVHPFSKFGARVSVFGKFPAGHREQTDSTVKLSGVKSYEFVEEDACSVDCCPWIEFKVERQRQRK